MKITHVTKCQHGIAMNQPCLHCDTPERVGPHDPATWTINKLPPCAAHGGE